MRQKIAAKQLAGSSSAIQNPVISIEDGRIISIESADSALRRADPSVLFFPEALIVPSFVDIHVHGAAGHDVMEESPDGLQKIALFLASRGVGAFFPTTVTATLPATLRALEQLAKAIEAAPPVTGAVLLGIHLEGPFLSHAKRGVHSKSLLAPPSIGLFESFRQAARGHIRIMTIAPELDGAAELIEYATASGVRCSLGHSDATFAQAAEGQRAGARSATHTFNAMRSLDHRDPGIAAYVLDSDEIFAEIICDGIHVDPAMVRLFFKAKGPERPILITDGTSATGMPDGRYKLGELEVEVAHGRCASQGSLAGSVLTLDRAVRNFAAYAGTDLSTAAACAARNPAKLAGVDHQWGSVEEGREANLNVLSANGEILQSFRAGRPVLP